MSHQLQKDNERYALPAIAKVERNDRLLAVLETRYNPPRYRSIDDVGEQSIAEIEHFFASFNEMEGRKFKIIGRSGSERARELVEQGSDGSERP